MVVFGKRSRNNQQNILATSCCAASPSVDICGEHSQLFCFKEHSAEKKKFASMLMAVWFLATAAVQKFAGILSGLYPVDGKHTSFLGYNIHNLYDFFMFFVGMAGIASLMLFIVTKKLQKMMPVA
jgi:hypothetical protein